MLEKECKRENGKLDWDEGRRRIAALSKDGGYSLRPRSQKIEGKILRARARVCVCAGKLNSYMACHKRNGCPVDGKVEADKIE